jgi:hypothetical protein
MFLADLSKRAAVYVEIYPTWFDKSIERKKRMKLSTLVEILNAVHLSRYVESPYIQRGGIMLVAPPASLKSSMLQFLTEYPSVMVISDLNVQSFNTMRSDIVAGHVSTLVFSDLEKLYQRHSSVSSNLEGHIKAIADEGFRRPSFQDQRAICIPAHAAVIACMTEDFYERKISQWLNDGFARRFIWAHYALQNPELILDALDKGQLVSLTGNGFSPLIPASKQIDGKLSSEESAIVARILRFHRQRETSTILMRKMVSVLKWKFKKEWKDIVHDFAQSLTPIGAKVTL